MWIHKSHENRGQIPRGGVFGPQHSHWFEQGKGNPRVRHLLRYGLQHSQYRQSIDFKAVTKHHDDKLTMFNDEWKETLVENDTGGKWNSPGIITSPNHSSSNRAESSYAFRSSLLPLYVWIGPPAFSNS